VRVLVLAGLALSGVAVLAGPAPAQPAPAPRTTLFAAHRGGALLWPENSLLAFRNAAEQLGADFLELDVHLTKDGEVVVIHDPTLDRTTTGRGPVRARTLAELRDVRLRDQKGAATAEVLPTLDEVVTLALGAGRQILLEIKLDETGRRYPAIEEKVFALLDRRGATAATVVMSFDRDTWRRARALRPAARTCALYSRRTIGDLGSTLKHELELARSAGVSFVGLHENLVDASTVALVREMGLTLGVWTVNENEAIRRFIELKVDVVITDRPDLAKRALGR
jgi:glycerophosphoryl diester phosphodiesterase